MPQGVESGVLEAWTSCFRAQGCWLALGPDITSEQLPICLKPERPTEKRLWFPPSCQLSRAVTPSSGLGFLFVDQGVGPAILPGPAYLYRVCGTETLSATLFTVSLSGIW